MRLQCTVVEGFLEEGAPEVWSVGWQEKEGWSHDQDRGRETAQQG